MEHEEPRAALEHEGLQTFLGKFLRCPTDADTRSYNNRVKSILLFRFYRNGGHLGVRKKAFSTHRSPEFKNKSLYQWLLIFRLRVPRWHGHLARGFEDETQLLLVLDGRRQTEDSDKKIAVSVSGDDNF